MKWQEYDVPEKVRKFKESFSSETYLQNISSEAELQNVVLVKNRIRKKKVVDPPPPPLPPHEPIETKNERAERLRMEELADEEIEIKQQLAAKQLEQQIQQSQQPNHKASNQ